MSADRSILTLEHKLGFRWERGLSRQTEESCQIPFIADMLSEIDALKEQYVHNGPADLRKSLAFRDNCDSIFEDYAPKIWPSPPAYRDGWLVQSKLNDWGGHYTRDLTYAELGDRGV